MNIDFLIEMAWKSTLIAGAALMLAALIRSRSAADRAALLRIAVALLLLLPLVSIALPALQVEIARGAADDAQRLPLGTLLAMAEASLLGSAPSAVEAGATRDDPSLLIAIAYLGGLLMVGFRLLAGLWTLRRWTASAEQVRSPEWNAAFARACEAVGGLPRVRFLVSSETSSPLSWGWYAPVILIDRDSLDNPEDAEAVLAHEVAHVVRGDWVTLMLSQTAMTLFWFNPLVWLIGRAAVDHAEEAADSQAIGRVEPARYAQTLLNFAQQVPAPSIPANCIASGGLKRRVTAILDRRLGDPPSGSAWTRAAMAGCILFAGPVAAIELIPASAAADKQIASAIPPVRPAIVTPTVPAPARPAVELAPLAVEEIPAAPPAPAPTAPPAAPSPPTFLAAAPAPLPAPDAPVAPIAPVQAFRAHMVKRAAAAAEAAALQAQHAVNHAVIRVRIDMDQGASQLEHGAAGMEQGARQMAEEARRLRSEDYRALKIAQAGLRGRRITHEELIDCIDDLQDGARDMIEGAREMRRGAAEMRNPRNDG